MEPKWKRNNSHQVAAEGPKWSRIVMRLPGRTVSSVRNRRESSSATIRLSSRALPEMEVRMRVKVRVGV